MQLNFVRITGKATKLYEGTLTVQAIDDNHAEMTIKFSQPFPYKGGNLLVGIDNLGSGNTAYINFYGENAPQGCSAYRYFEGNYTETAFLPRTTFHYTPPTPVGTFANADGTYSVRPGTELTVKATPAEEFHLGNWSNGAEVNTELTNTFTMGTTDLELIANFMRNKYELTIGAGKFATFFAGESVALSAEQAAAGAALYTITAIDDDHTTATLTQLGNIAAATTPMLVYNGSEAQMTVVLTPTTDAPTATAVEPIAEFRGTAVNKTFTDVDMAAADYYALSGGEAFAKVKGTGTLKTNQSWLQFDKQQQPGARAITLVFEAGETTGIGDMNRETINNNHYYDLQGRRVQKTTKGIYISNGRKLVK